MTKKNRFTMLEGVDNKEAVPDEKPKDSLVPLKDVKVVVPKDEFELNLKKHKLTEKITEIERQKIDLKIEVDKAMIRSRAWYLTGSVAVFLTIKKFYRTEVKDLGYEGDDQVIGVTKFEMTPMNYFILGLFALTFFLYKNNNTKGKK